MTHPADLLDVDAAAAHVLAAHRAGRYWDERAVRVRPELADAGSDDLHRILEMLSEEDDADPDVAPDRQPDVGLTPAADAALSSWLVRRAHYAREQLRLIPVEPNRTIAVWREIQCRPDDVRSDLGVHWTWDPDFCGGAQAFWTPHAFDEEVPVILFIASAPVESVDWQVTLLCAMDYLCGDDERELRLKDGAPLSLVEMHVDADPVTIPDALREDVTA